MNRRGLTSLFSVVLTACAAKVTRAPILASSKDGSVTPASSTLPHRTGCWQVQTPKQWKTTEGMVVLSGELGAGPSPRRPGGTGLLAADNHGAQVIEIDLRSLDILRESEQVSFSNDFLALAVASGDIALVASMQREAGLNELTLTRLNEFNASGSPVVVAKEARGGQVSVQSGVVALAYWKGNDGNAQGGKAHLAGLDLSTGKVLWDRVLKNISAEDLDPYGSLGEMVGMRGRFFLSDRERASVSTPLTQGLGKEWMNGRHRISNGFPQWIFALVSQSPRIR